MVMSQVMLVDLNPLHWIRHEVAEITGLRALRTGALGLATVTAALVNDHHPLANSLFTLVPVRSC